MSAAIEILDKSLKEAEFDLESAHYELKKHCEIIADAEFHWAELQQKVQEIHSALKFLRGYE